MAPQAARHFQDDLPGVPIQTAASSPVALVSRPTATRCGPKEITDLIRCSPSPRSTDARAVACHVTPSLETHTAPSTSPLRSEYPTPTRPGPPGVRSTISSTPGPPRLDCSGTWRHAVPSRETQTAASGVPLEVS